MSKVAGAFLFNSAVRCAHAITAWRTVCTRSVALSLPSSPSPTTITAFGRGIRLRLSGSTCVFKKIWWEPGAMG